MTKSKNYTGIDVFRMIAAIFVVSIHISPLANYSVTGDFILTRVIARVAVPFFFMTSGYFLYRSNFLSPNINGNIGKRTKSFIGKDGGDNQKLLSFLKKIVTLYIIVMILYLPLNIYMGYFNTKPFLPNLIKDIVFDGTIYHLWYFPATILGALISSALINKMGYKRALYITGVLYLIGLLGDSYYGVVNQVPILRRLYEFNFTVSDYTRNGIFYAPVFFSLGALISRKKENRMWRLSFVPFFIILLLMIGEGLLLRNSEMQRHDSMYLLLLPCMYFLFTWLLSFRGKRIVLVRDMSTVIYIIHPMIIVFVRLAAKILHLESILIDNSLVLFGCVLILSSVIAYLYCILKNHDPKRGKRMISKNQEEQQEKSRSWLEINLDCIDHNVKVIEGAMAHGCNLMAVVKAEAYGHGGSMVAKRLYQKGVKAFAVAAIEEGITLRKQGILGEILILGYTPSTRIKALKKYQLIQTVVSLSHGRELCESGVTIDVHLAIDSGMHRLGIGVDEVEDALEIFQMDHLNVKGIFTHLSVSDSLETEDIKFTNRQITNFYNFLEHLEHSGVKIPKVHIQSSYGFLNYPNLTCDYVRIGILLYGVHTKEDTKTNLTLDLKPALALKSRVVLVREIKAGEEVGYDRAFSSQNNRKIAVISIGYADGYPRALSCQKGEVLIRGKRVPVVGKICMDQMFVDVTEVKDVTMGDIVTLIGRDQEEEIKASQVAVQAESITNELLSRMGRRLRYVYQ